MARRKEIYEILDPETKAPKLGGSFRGNQHSVVTADAVVTNFTNATAAATGKPIRTVREIVARGKAPRSDNCFAPSVS